MTCDIVVLGATGFTGSLVVECLVKRCEEVTWTIAARSEQKIKNLIDSLNSKGMDISQVPTCLVDVNVNESLQYALRNAKLVLNCVGPYTALSETVVETCIKLGVHYVDVSAEVNHILTLSVKHHELAEASNTLIIPSCGFSSLVTASGLMFLQKQFVGTLFAVECYTEFDIPNAAKIPFLESIISYGTWSSLLQVLIHYKEYMQQKNDIFPAISLPMEMKRNLCHWRRGKLWFPYPGPDESVIGISERFPQQKPYHFKQYATTPHFIQLLILVPVLLVYFYLSYFKCFVRLLLKFPWIFSIGYVSHKGPSEKSKENTKYALTYIGKGRDNDAEKLSTPSERVVEVKTSSKDPYGTSAQLMVIAAITLLKEQSLMPRGGVVNLLAAFHKTNLLEMLMDIGIKYEVITP